MAHNKSGGLVQISEVDKASIPELGAFGKRHGQLVDRLMDEFFALLQKEKHLSQLCKFETHPVTGLKRRVFLIDLLVT